MENTLNIIDDYIVILDKNFDLVFCNDKLLKKLEYKIDEIKYKKISNLIENRESISFKEESINLIFVSKFNKRIVLSSKVINQEGTILIIAKDIEKIEYTVKELEQLLDNLPFNCWLKNVKGEYLYVNKSYAKELNDNRNDILGKTSRDYWSEEEAELFSSMDNEVISSKKYQVTEHHSKKNGIEKWTETYKAPIFNENNIVKYLIGYTKDITFQKNIDNEVQKNNKQINDINNILDKLNEKKSMKESLKNIGDNIIKYLECDGLEILLVDKNTYSIELNIESGVKGKYKFSDYVFKLNTASFNNIISSNYINIIRHMNEIEDKTLNQYMELNNIDNIGIYSILVDDNTIGLLVLKFFKNNNLKYNKFDYIKNLCDNIAYLIKNYLLSSELQNEFEIRKRIERELELYLEISVDLVARLDLNGNIQYLNNNWNSTLGWDIDELKSINILDIVHKDFVELYRDIIFNNINDSGHMITKFISKNKSDKWVDVNYRINRFEDSIIITAKDITEEKKREEENKKLEEAIQMESLKSEFFANISHEFRTPLNIILGTMQLIQSYINRNKINWDDSLNLESYIHYIRQNSYRLLRLVNNLIDMTCIDSGYFKVEMGNHDIINIIESITLSIVGYVNEKGINLTFDTNMEEIIIACDPDKIERIMLNLLSNAIKYTEKDGNIDVNIEVVSDIVKVYVQDNGTGMSKDKLDIIFDRFKRIDSELNRKCEGSGIGLSLVKSLVELHNGIIYVESELGLGSKFTFEIPVTHVNNGIENKVNNEVINNAQIEKCNIEFSDIYQ